MRTQSTAMRVNTIRRWAWTSLRLSGKVEPLARADGEACVPRHGGACVASDVVGGSRLGRGCASEDGNGSEADIDCPQGSPAGVSEANQKQPLGIPTVRDRVVQSALKMVIEPIFEREFAPRSYGFRPGRGCKDALREVERLLRAGYLHVVDVDIKG